MLLENPFPKILSNTNHARCWSSIHNLVPLPGSTHTYRGISSLQGLNFLILKRSFIRYLNSLRPSHLFDLGLEKLNSQRLAQFLELAIDLVLMGLQICLTPLSFARSGAHQETISPSYVRLKRAKNFHCSAPRTNFSYGPMPIRTPDTIGIH